MNNFIQVSYEIAAVTDTGRRRTRNEDHVRIVDEHLFAVLADGMGGHQAGDVASKMAVDIICNNLTQRLESHTASDKLTAADLSEVVSIANRSIYKDSQLNPDHQGMGSTVVVFTLLDMSLICAHVGDSRLYHIHSNAIRQVTTDHTLAQHYVDMGIMSATEAATWHGRNMLMRGLGIEAEATADINEVKLIAGDVVIACSDGLTDVLSDDEIMRVVSSQSTPLGAANRLVAVANSGGGPDNITVVVVYVT